MQFSNSQFSKKSKVNISNCMKHCVSDYRLKVLRIFSFIVVIVCLDFALFADDVLKFRFYSQANSLCVFLCVFFVAVVVVVSFCFLTLCCCIFDERDVRITVPTKNEKNYNENNNKKHE